MSNSESIELLANDEPGVLIVGFDDPSSLAAYFLASGLRVEVAGDPREMDRALASLRFDVVIIEIACPGGDALSICRRLATGSPSVILMSAECEEVDRIVGLELGAAYYLPKSCGRRELLAHIRAVCRMRKQLRTSIQRRYAGYRFGDFELDPTRDRLLGPTGEATLLTQSELTLLLALLEREGEPLGRKDLASASRNGCRRSERAVDAGISRLRRKLGGGDPDALIRTVRGVGYALSVPAHRA